MAPAHDPALSTHVERTRERRAPRRAKLPSRTFLLIPAGISLLAGLDAALLLAGVIAPVQGAALPARHGMLMTLGFLGTLIALERAVALRRTWAYAAPILLGAGGLALTVGLPVHLGTILLADGGVAMLAVYAGLYQRQHDETTAVQALGAVGATGAAILWLRLPIPQLVLWLVAFVVLTICAERIELARLSLPKSAAQLLLVISTLLMVTTALSLLKPDLGARASGLVLLILTGWLLMRDVARHTIKLAGLPRLSAAALLGGYVWLAAAGLVWLYVGTPTTTATYDTVVHGVFLGFGMSMVIAHAPVILPAIIRRPMPYRWFLWLPLVVLHLSLVARIIGANALDLNGFWTIGAVLGVIALLLLPLTVIACAATPARRAR